MAPKKSESIVEISKLQLRRSSRIKKRTANNVSCSNKRLAENLNIGKSVTKKSRNLKKIYENEQNASTNVIQTMEEESPIAGKRVRSGVKDDEDHESLIPVVEETCLIDRLPTEVLEMIFAYLSCKDRANVRLVCKFWYERNYNENVYIDGMKEENVKYIEYCGLNRWNLHMESYLVSTTLPQTVWEKIGTNLTSIFFFDCQLGDSVMENVIIFCDNLRILRVNVALTSLKTSFCTPETLEEIYLTRSKLETLEICGNSWPEIQPLYLYHSWKRIFDALLRIFPNIKYYTAGRECIRTNLSGNDDEEVFWCAFTKDFQENDNFELASCLAYSLSTKTSNWRKAMDALSTLRLTSLSLTFAKLTYTEEDQIALLNLFTNQKTLKVISIQFQEYINVEMLKSVIFQIFDHASAVLQTFKYSSRLTWDHQWAASVSEKFWLHNLSASELKLLQSRTSNLKEFSLDGFLMKGFSLFTYAGTSNLGCLFPEFEMSLKCLMPHYSHLRRLSLINRVSDECLQSIFQYMTELRILSIRLHSTNTNYGIIGRRNENSANLTSGYSISRLRHLLRLKIEWCQGCRVNDRIYYEFNFPKMLYLSCLAPYVEQPSSVLMFLAREMPFLKEINISWKHRIPSRDLFSFCELAKNLRTIHLVIGPFSINQSKAKIIFEKCPTLRFLHCYIGTYYWEPFSREVIFRANSDWEQKRNDAIVAEHVY